MLYRLYIEISSPSARLIGQNDSEETFNWTTFPQKVCIRPMYSILSIFNHVVLAVSV